ncbi:MAG TPA: ABC transporter permease, partial [Thermoanaerobaculia bacterium]|nr:ABC transporter permease [Thermoanaerobaculia bacterium]
GAVLVVALVVVALAAPWLAPWEPGQQLDPVAGRYLPPGSVRVPVVFGDGRSLLADAVAWRGAELVIERLGRQERYPAAALAEPTPGEPGRPRRFHLGTDRFGRDVLSRLLHGARVSLAIGVLAAALAIGLGTLVGAAAATGGPWADGVLMRLVDAVLAVPRLFLLIALVALLRPGMMALVLVLAATGWMSVSRLLRAEIQALQAREFVLAARGLGQHPVRILAVHLLPNALTPVLVMAGLLVGQAILAESSLSFLGLGVPPPVPSWGEMVASGADRLLGAWWVATFPGLAIVVTVIAFNLLTDGLRDLLDPHH